MKKFLLTFSISLLFVVLAVMGVSADSTSFELENATINNGFAVVEDGSASGGKYLGSSYWCQIPELTMLSNPPAAEVEFEFEVKDQGIYNIFFRLTGGRPYDNDSVYFSIDDFYYVHHFGREKVEYIWTRAAVAKLEPGKHKVRMWNREPGARLDKMVITDNPFFSPQGVGVLPERDAEFYKDGSGDLIAHLPSFVPPAEHPRLFIRKTDIAKIRENLEHPQNIKVYNRVKELAASKHTGNQTNYDAEMYEIMQSKAFMYVINGDLEMGKQAVNMLMNHIPIADMGYKNAGGSGDSMRFGGYVIFTAAIVYDWCYDLFTPEQRDIIIKSCEELAAINFEGGYPTIEHHNVLSEVYHNCENPLFKDLLAFGIASYDEKPFMYDNTLGILNMNYFPWRNWYYSSHNMTDGVSTYGDFRLAFETFCTYMLDKIGYRPLDLEDQHYTMYKSVYWRRPDGTYWRDGDEARNANNYAYTKNPHAGYFLSANLNKDPNLKWQYYKNLASPTYTAENYTSITGPLYLVINDTDVPIENRAELPLTKYYGSPFGMMMARTSWEEGADSNAMMVAMVPKENFFKGHSHIETGHFVIYYKGALALDSGAYQAPASVADDGTVIPAVAYGSSPNWTYYVSPVAHNVLLVYDPEKPEEIQYGGQWHRLGAGSDGPKNINEAIAGSHKMAENLAYDYGPDKNKPEYSYLESDLSYAYIEERVTSYTRSYMFLNLFDDEIPGAFIVLDRIESPEKAFEKAWLLHSQEEPKIEGNKVTIDRTEWHNSGRLTNTVLMPESFIIDKVGGPGYDYWDGVKNQLITREPVGDESGAWRIEVKPAVKQKTDYFLNVMQTSDPDDSIKHHEVTSNEQGDFIGIFIADRAVFMKKDAGKVYEDFDVTAKGEGEISYIITNLAEGIWTVKDKDGKVVASEAIADEHGVLRFRTTPGTYHVSWDYAEYVAPKKFNITDDSLMLDYRPVSFFVNDKHYNGTGRLEDGHVLMSLNDFAELTNGASFEVKDDTYYGKGVYGDISGTIGSAQAVINGKGTTLSYPAKMFDGKVYLSIDDLKDVFEYEYEYDDLTYILYFRGGYYMVPGADLQIVNVADRNRADIKTVTCSGYLAEDRNAYKSLDDTLSSYWTIGGKGQWIQFELMEEYELTGVGIAWIGGNQRIENFEIYVSVDGVNWTEMWKGDSSGKTLLIEETKFDKPVKAKYVKIVGNGNTVNEMNSMAEFHAYCTDKIPYYEK